jgi:hypothetical protein
MHSAREGLPPRYPNLPKPPAVKEADATSSLGTALRSFGELNDELDVACQIVSALDHPKIDLQVLDNPRRWLIHNLLSTSFDDDALTESYRLAFLLFIEVVIYPFPSCANVKPRLCKSLLESLEQVNDWDCEPLVWVIVMGGMCSKGSEREKIFAEYFVSHCDHFKDWEALHSMMRQCLWHPVCHGIGYGFGQTCCLKMAYR